MNRMELFRLMEQNAIPSVLLFEGEEEYLKHEALQRLRHCLLPEGME